MTCTSQSKNDTIIFIHSLPSHLSGCKKIGQIRMFFSFFHLIRQCGNLTLCPPKAVPPPFVLV